MGNLIANLFLWAWSNFIGWPKEESRLTGFIRIMLYSYILSNYQNYFLGDNNDTLPIFLGVFCIIQFIVGILQFGGLHSINGPFDFKLNREIKEGIADGSIKVINPVDRSFDKMYPGLSWWFRVRNHHMAGLSNTEKAKFFVQTGGLTEGSVQDLSKYPHTKRAIERLDYECRRPAKELIEFMKGNKRI
jgi:hypothetical protein